MNQNKHIKSFLDKYSNRVKPSVKRLVGIALIAIVLFVGMSTSKSASDLKLGANIRIMAEILRELSINYVDQVDSDQMLEAAAKAMTRELDPYTEYIPESGISDFEFMTTGKYGGVGALIRTKGDYTMISEPYKNTPADKAGLKAGDLIIEIDGKSIKNLESSKVSNLMKGSPGTKLELTIDRIVDGQRVVVELIRDRITVSGVSYYGMLEDSIGIIVHDQFTEHCSNDIRNAFNDLRAKGAKSLILDLRNNGGGILQEAVEIVSMFVDKNTEVVSTRGRSKSSQETFRTSLEPIDTQIPIAVLVNNMSASASEIVAGSLQDLDRAVLVGQRTFGKGLVQSPVPVGQKSYLKLTTAKYYIPSGRCIQAIDYAHRDSEGAVSHVPDSLVKEFKTLAGRKVYDGGGITPDIEAQGEDISEFVANLYSLGHIEDFANDYYRRHAADSVDSSFKLSDQEYALFENSLADKEIKFRSRSSYYVDQLRSQLKQQGDTTSIESQLKEIEAIISPDKWAGLARYKDEITSIIESNIVRRYCYSWGAVEYSLLSDPQLKAAITTLQDQQKYRSLLESDKSETEI